MKLNLRIWRQENAGVTGRLADYQLDDVSPDSSFLEMLDLLNENLTVQGEEPVAFDSDCREGICGMCGVASSGRQKLRNEASVCASGFSRSKDRPGPGASHH